MAEEQAWIEEVLKGNNQAFAYLVNKYKNKVCSILVGMGNTFDDAQDMTQEAFIKAYKYLKTYDPKNTFSSWLYRIAINHCYSEWKKKNRCVEVEWGEFEPTSIAGNPEMEFEIKERNSELKKEIEKLSHHYRLILLLRYVDNLSYREISSVLDIPLNLVKVHLYRARKQLKQQIVTRGDVYEMFNR
jgi:RNA polymerase sigma factor (sigma-70 family)